MTINDQSASQTAAVRRSVPEEAAEDAALAEALCVAVGEAAGAPVAAAARPAVTEATAQPRLPLLGHGSIVSREWKARKNWLTISMAMVPYLTRKCAVSVLQLKPRPAELYQRRRESLELGRLVAKRV